VIFVASSRLPLLSAEILEEKGLAFEPVCSSLIALASRCYMISKVSGVVVAVVLIRRAVPASVAAEADSEELQAPCSWNCSK